MILHTIHNLKNNAAIKLLNSGLSNITDSEIIKNYHPDFSSEPGNLFFILKNGRYAKGNGTYYILEEHGQYVCSAGWNEYEYDPTIAFALTRMYTDPSHRGKYLVANHILTQTLKETAHYSKIWLTVNKHNKLLYEWFVRADQGKSTGLVNNWPDVYKKFKPIGQMKIYNTDQYVVELQK